MCEPVRTLLWGVCTNGPMYWICVYACAHTCSVSLGVPAAVYVCACAHQVHLERYEVSSATVCRYKNPGRCAGAHICKACVTVRVCVLRGFAFFFFLTTVTRGILIWGPQTSPMASMDRVQGGA